MGGVSFNRIRMKCLMSFKSSYTACNQWSGHQPYRKNCEFVRFERVRTLIKTDLRTGTKAKSYKPWCPTYIISLILLIPDFKRSIQRAYQWRYERCSRFCWRSWWCGRHNCRTEKSSPETKVQMIDNGRIRTEVWDYWTLQINENQKECNST